MADGSIIIDTKIDDKNVGQQLSGLKKNIQDGIASTAKAATTIMAGLTAAIGAVGAASINFTKTTDRIDKMSQSLGLSRQTFQELDYVFAQNGISIDSLGMGIKTLQQSISGASKDSGDMTNALNKLGITVKDANGNFKDQDTILKESLVALQNMQPGLEKALAAEQLFGRSAQDLMPLLNQQAGSMDELTARAQELGLVMGDDAVNAGVELGDLIADLKASFNALLNDAIAPIIPQINILIKDFIAWATEGDRLKNMISGVANFIVKAFQSGIIPALAGGALTVKVLSVAMGVLNAVMAANPVSLIILGIGALVAAIIVLYKNWDKVVYFFQMTFAKIGAAVAILGSKIKEGFIVAFNASKIAALSLAQIIFDKVLGAVQAMLGQLSKLPLVGEQFAKVNNFVGNLREGLDAAADAAKQESAEAIAAAREAQDAAEERYRETQAAAEAAAKARLAEIEANKAAAEAEKDAARKKAEEEQAALYRVAETVQEVSDQEKELAAARKRYAEETAILQAKRADGVITEKELNDELLSQAKRYQDQLYQLGYTAQQSNSAGADALRETSRLIDELNKKLKTNDIPRKAGNLGEDVAKNFALALKENASIALEQAGAVVQGIGSAIAAGAKFVSDSIKFIGSVIKGIADFDPKSIFESFKKTIEGLAEFIFTDLGSLPLYVEAGKNVLKEFGEGIVANKEAIFKTIKNVITNITDTIKRYAPDFLEQGTIIVIELVSGIINELPLIIDAALEIVMALIDGIIIGLPLLLQSIFNSFTGIIQSIINRAPDIIAAALELVKSLAFGLISNFPILQLAMVDMIMQLMLVIVDMLPEIVQTFIEMIPMMSVAMISQQAVLIASIVELIFGIIAAIVNMLFNFPELGKAIIDGLIEGFTRAGATLWDTIKGIFEKLVTSFKNFFGIHSPSTMFADFGVNMIEGLIGGIKSMGSGLWNTLKGIGSGVSDFFSNVGTGVSNIAGGIGDFFGGIFGFASGSPYIEQDQVAQIHRGERIVPADFNSSLMSGETMMLSPDALAGLIAALPTFGSGAQFMGARNASAGMSTIKLIAKMDGQIDVDGRQIGRVAFEYADEMVGNAYGV